MLARISLCWVTLLSAISVDAADEPAWIPVIPQIEPSQDRVSGNWSKSGNELVTTAEAGSRLELPVAPTGEYDVRLTFTRRTGVHSIALMFVQNGHQATFEVDAWGNHLAGIQSIGGQDLRQNATRTEGQTLQNGRKYTMTLEVRRDQCRAFLDDNLLVTYRGDGSNLSTVDVWRMPHANRLGIGAWESETVFHTIEVRSRGATPIEIARSTARPNPSPTPAPTTPSPMPTNARGKRVLMVIANQDFFYREYGDPRAELERAGIQVTVAAGQKSPCRPHDGSGQGPDGGIVRPDIALAEAKAENFDAILFSGGWGASAYQFAFNGRYANPAYNGDRNVKAEVNRLINEFVAQDKYVCALCNGVSILAWARVNGQSPLKGKRVCSPVRQAAAGIYNGRPDQPSCRWHPEANGALLSPAGSIGNPGTNTDDVLVDGKIITGEDDPSARELGRRLAMVLSNGS